MAAAILQAFLVQDKDSGLFLAPSDYGGVGYVKLICDACPVYDLETAVEMAQEHIGPNYVIFTFLEQSR